MPQTILVITLRAIPVLYLVVTKPLETMAALDGIFELAATFGAIDDAIGGFFGVIADPLTVCFSAVKHRRLLWRIVITLNRVGQGGGNIFTQHLTPPLPASRAW